MNRVILLCFVLFITCPGSAQSIFGVINTYTKVTGISCNNITVTSAAGYNAGDTVMIIQMKGALIDISNTGAFGSILNYNEAGNYEFNIIQSVSGNIIYLQSSLQRAYNPAGSVQLIKVPYYNNVTVSGTLTALPWNGDTGGVLVLTALGNITLNADINITGLGFKGGSASINYFNNNGICHSGYFYTKASGLGAQKGEGIAVYNNTYESGRGALANGGGGGNHVNAGGAGGGNSGSGGDGGFPSTPCSIIPIGGVGGCILNYNNIQNKIFLGGGGGGGHQNDGVGTAGTNGGGIVFIKANTIIGNNKNIISSGTNNIIPTGGYDGAGGGGAGGTILLDVPNYNSSLKIQADGGKGGDVNHTICHGPGGGGGGGMIWLKSAALPGNISFSLAPGLPGKHIAGGCSADPSYGAGPGTAGNILYNLQKPSPVMPVLNTSVKNVCTGNTITLNANSGYISYSWLPGGQTTQIISVSPTTTSTYTVNATDSQGCINIFPFIVRVNPLPVVNAGNNDTICSGLRLQLNGQGAINYQWSPSTGLNSSTMPSPLCTPLNNITYTLTGIDSNGCLGTDTIHLVILSKAKAGFTLNPDAGQTPLTVNFTNTSSNATNYQWMFGDNSVPDTTINPTHVYTEASEYRVQLIANNSNNCPDTAIYTFIKAETDPVLWIPNSFTPTDDGVNDIFKVYGTGITMLEVRIFNRWGELFYEWSTLNEGWDGTYKGSLAEEGIYVYTIKAKKEGYKDYNIIGHISLIR